MGACWKVRECERSRDMAFIRRGVGSMVKITKDTG